MRMADMLRSATLELVPSKDIGKQIDMVSTSIPEGSRLEVATHAQSRPQEDELVCGLARMGHTVVPHVAARLYTDEAHLFATLDDYATWGVTDVFVIGGDQDPPAGRFDSALQILQAMAQGGYVSHPGAPFVQVGVPLYPQGHRFLSGDTLRQHLDSKLIYATYMTTQFALEATPVVDHVRGLRGSGIATRVRIGVLGAVDMAKLPGFARKYGTRQVVTAALDLVRSSPLAALGSAMRGYDPSPFLAGLAPFAEDESANVCGFVFYSMGRMSRTLKARDRICARLAG